jgi:phosphatidylinositol alpha-1,6-mannosyltransferase
MAEVVHVLTHEFAPFRGGIGIYVEETASALVRAGQATTVWAPAYGQSHTDGFPFTVNRVQMRGKQDWLCRLKLASALRKAFPSRRIPGTVLLAEPGPIRLWMYRQAMQLPRPDRLLIVLHGSEIVNLSRSSRRLNRFRKLLLEADRIGVVSVGVRELLLAVCPEVEERVVCVPGAVRSAWNGLPVPEREDAPSRVEVLQVGRLHPRKGQDVLVEAVAQLPDPLRRDIRVRLIGPAGKAPYLEHVRTRIQERELPVSIDGILDEESLKEAYRTARILVMPSRSLATSVEGLGLALLEAAHFGCAVIGSRVGGIPEALQEGETGLLVPPDDPAALASALERLLTHRDLTSRMGAAGSAFVRDNFSWDRNVRQLVDF